MQTIITKSRKAIYEVRSDGITIVCERTILEGGDGTQIIDTILEGGDGINTQSDYEIDGGH